MNAELSEGDPTDPIGLRRRRWMRRFGFVLALVALGYYLGALREHATALRALSWAPSAIGWFVSCVSVYPLTYALGAGIWCLILRSLGSVVGFRTALSIAAVSQFGKYLPGNVAHHVGRVALAKREGLAIDRVVVSLLLETANLLLAGTLVASLLLLPGSDAAGALLSRTTLLVVMAVGVFIVVAAALTQLWRGYRRQHRDAVPAIELRWVLPCVAIQCVAFLLHGVIVALLVTGVLDLPRPPVAALTATFALAWLAGFVTPGAPAGIGIREAVMSIGFAPLLGAGGAVALAGLLRMVSVLGDLLTFVLGIGLTRGNRGS